MISHHIGGLSTAMNAQEEEFSKYLSSLEKASPRKKRIESIWQVERRNLEQSCQDCSEVNRENEWLPYEKKSAQVGSSAMQVLSYARA